MTYKLGILNILTSHFNSTEHSFGDRFDLISFLQLSYWTERIKSGELSWQLAEP